MEQINSSAGSHMHAGKERRRSSICIFILLLVLLQKTICKEDFFPLASGVHLFMLYIYIHFHGDNLSTVSKCILDFFNNK
jgi:hypothetical protein